MITWYAHARAYTEARWGPVIGPAKTAFRSASHAHAVLRGGSSRSLYVTAAGMTVAEASVVREMAGRFWLPDALKLADRARPRAGDARRLACSALGPARSVR